MLGTRIRVSNALGATTPARSSGRASPSPGVHARLLAQKAPRAPPTEAGHGEVGQVDTKTPRRPRRGEVRESDARSQTRRAIDYATIRGEAGRHFLCCECIFQCCASCFLWSGTGVRHKVLIFGLLGNVLIFGLLGNRFDAGTALVTEKVRRAPYRLLLCTTVL